MSEFRVSSITVVPVTPTESRIDMSIGDEPNMEHADESVALSVTIIHEECPTIQELQLKAIRRAQDMLVSQSRVLTIMVGGPRK